MTRIAEKINKVKDVINSTCAKIGRDTSQIKLVVVTKSVEIDTISEVIGLGITELGENRVQQLKKVSAQVDELLKQAGENSALPKKVNWHMIGHLQRNKVQGILGLTSMIHSVDTLRLAEEINSSAEKMDLCPRVLLQVNTSEEPQKYGVPVGAAIHLAEQFETMPNVRLCGLMTIGPLTNDTDSIRACFARMKELFIEIRKSRLVGPHFDQLSMGMSHDYQIAIEEGTTMLRIGSAIFTS